MGGGKGQGRRRLTILSSLEVRDAISQLLPQSLLVHAHQARLMTEMPLRRVLRLGRPGMHVRQLGWEDALRYVQRLVAVRPDRAVGRRLRRRRCGLAAQRPARVRFDDVAVLGWGLVQVGALGGRQVLDDGCARVAGVEVGLEEGFVEGEDELELDAEGKGKGGVGHGCGWAS